jgi:hypothetical protein
MQQQRPARLRDYYSTEAGGNEELAQPDSD